MELAACARTASSISPTRSFPARTSPSRSLEHRHALDPVRPRPTDLRKAHPRWTPSQRHMRTTRQIETSRACLLVLDGQPGTINFPEFALQDSRSLPARDVDGKLHRTTKDSRRVCRIGRQWSLPTAAGSSTCSRALAYMSRPGLQRRLARPLAPTTRIDLTTEPPE
jgi:hypothetical protein